jgi:hypothetical protein
MVLEQGDHIAGEQCGERGQKALHKVGNREIAQQCRQKEHKRKDGKQEVIGQLRRPAQAIVRSDFLDNASSQLCNAEPPRNTGFVDVASGVDAVNGGRAVTALRTPAPGGLTGSRSLWSTVYPRNPSPASVRSVGRPCFQSHAMVLLLS